MRKEHILEFVYSEFAACGFKRVNVDDLASKMRISKKTLYEMFSNKEKLFLEAINLKSGKILWQCRRFLRSVKMCLKS